MYGDPNWNPYHKDGDMDYFSLLAKLAPEALNIEKATATLKALMANKDVLAAIDTIERVSKIVSDSEKKSP